MANHPNRSQSTAAGPQPAAVIAARQAAGLTQEAAGKLIYASLRAWQQWESGGRAMRAADFELFQLKTGQLALADVLGKGRG